MAFERYVTTHMHAPFGGAVLEACNYVRMLEMTQHTDISRCPSEFRPQFVRMDRSLLQKRIMHHGMFLMQHYIPI
jgi:hypothetical protein